MVPLHRQEMATILLLILPTVSCLVPRLSIQHIQSVRNHNFRKIPRVATAYMATATQLSLGIDPTDIVAQHGHLLQHPLAPTSALDFLSSLTLAKADVLPNQSLAPLAETIKGTDGNLLRVLPDMPTMPGGAPRTGNAFLAESFRELYHGGHKFDPQAPGWTAPSAGSVVRYSGGASLVVPAGEWDVVARYADLLGRLPLAATVYALIDFFLINAEEDLFLADFFDEEEEVQAMIEVENTIVLQRFIGLFLVTTATLAWSYLTYHPVPFSEL